MRKAIVFVLLASVWAFGCKKDQKPASTPNDTPVVTNNEPQSTDSGNKQIATGDMRDILLALKRVHFGFDESALNDEARNALDEASVKLQAHPEVELFVDGHTDEQGTTEYNMSLGDRRAVAVIDYLKHSGVTNRLTKISFGEEAPMVQGHDAVAHAKNRRVEYRLISGEVEFVLEDTAPVVEPEKPEETASNDASAAESDAP